MTLPAEFLHDLENRIRAEKRHGLEKLEKQWSLPLAERVRKRRAIGPLQLLSSERDGSQYLHHFNPSKSDIADFREGSHVRISRDSPADPGFLTAEFLGLTAKGLTIALGQDLGPDTHGWTIDEDFVDLSGYYLSGIEELSATDHGLQQVLPVLMGEEPEQAHDEHTSSQAADAVEKDGAEDSQIDAVSACIGAERYHLVQGPPGTGKTRVLAWIVRELVKSGNRVLVTAFTHRAIHHALRQISPLVSCPVFKVSDLFPHDREGIEFRRDFASTDLLDHPGPYVLGITPVSLFTSRAKEASFDVAVIDEASQMRTEAAILPMLRAKRWFFFGDQQQLPPVVARPGADPKGDSIFATLAAGRYRTMLRTTYRMNDELTRWPSENFYHGELTASPFSADKRLRLESPAGSLYLTPEPSLIRIEIDHRDCEAISHEEVDVASGLVEDMLRGGLQPDEIGIVVPFRAQAAGIRDQFRFKRFARFPGIESLAVDTVERFQGQERKAMIVSFTVSDAAFIGNLSGFLTYPQRLNVAVTRARTKVILLHSAAFHIWLQKQAPFDESAALALSLLQSAAALPPP